MISPFVYVTGWPTTGRRIWFIARLTAASYRQQRREPSRQPQA